jgi:hypothetical protein
VVVLEARDVGGGANGRSGVSLAFPIPFHFFLFLLVSSFLFSPLFAHANPFLQGHIGPSTSEAYLKHQKSSSDRGFLPPRVSRSRIRRSTTRMLSVV